MQTATGISERKACGLAGISRSVMNYEPMPDGNEELRSKIVDLAQVRKRFGYRRIHALLRREGIEVNAKRVYRLYTEENLSVRRRKRRKGKASLLSATH